MPQPRRPVVFKIRFYPGQDADLIRWLGLLDGEPYGAKTQALKETLRRGLAAGEPVPVVAPAPVLDLVEVRQVVEAAVASALGRFEGRVVGVVPATTKEQDDEVEDLLDRLEQALVLGEDDL
jgi:hypothetical protein